MNTHHIAVATAALVAALAGSLLGAAPANAQDTTLTQTHLTLGDAARIAARNAAPAQTARVRTAEAQAQVREARADLLPQITGTGQQLIHTLNTASFGIAFPSQPGQPPLFAPNGQIIPPFNTIDFRGHVSQTLFDFGAISRVRGARAAVAASSAQATVASEQAGDQAALAYIQALRAEEDVRARSEDSVFAADLVRIAQAQLQAGTGIILDVTRSQAQLAAVRAQLIASRAQRDRTRIALARALNLPADASLTLADSLGSESIGDLSTDEPTATQRALQNRPDIVAARAQIAAAQQSVAAIRAERLPSVSLFGDDGVNGKSYRYLLNTYEYGFQLTVPVLDGFRREGRIEVQQGAVTEAQIQQRNIEQQAGADVRTAILDLQSASQQVAATREGLRLAEQEVSQARERFRAGVAGNADVITALLNLTTAHTAVIDAQTNYQNARVSLARAQGAVTTLP